VSADRHVRITTDGHRGHIELDGVEISHGIHGFAFTAKAGELPTLRLDPLVMVGDVEHHGPLRVEVLPATRDALVALGWTPPVEGLQSDCACGKPVDVEAADQGGRAVTYVEDAGFWHKDCADAARAAADEPTCEGGC
jgi:hypothetical protein